MAIGEIFKGEEILFLVEIDDEGEKIIRPFDQTGGSTSIEADEIDIDTKDRSGSDYGTITETVSLEGNITEGDPFPDEMKKAIRGKEFVKIYEINTRTLEGEYGMYMISSFEQEYDNGEFAEYSLEGTLFGDICETTFTAVPDGAPALGGMDCESETDIPNGGGNVEG